MEHFRRVLRGKNIPVSNHFDLHGLFYFSYDIPVRFPAVILLACSAMDRNGICARIFSHFRKSYRIFFFLRKSGPKFNAHRNIHRFFQGGNDLPRKRRFPHKRASLSVIYDLWRRATHIYIYSKQTLSDQTAYFFRRLRENIRLSAEKLNADFLFERRDCEQLLRTFVPIGDTFCADHFRKGHLGPA